MSARRTKYYLDKRNGKIMGVCSGIADYTGVDVTLVRVAVALLTIFALNFVGVVAYVVIGLVASDKPRQFYSEDREDAKFWQGVRAKPSNSIRDVRARFRDIDRRLADVETHVTSQNSQLAREIEALR
ncbi:envelope stress response membrane protein PspC [Sphingomonas oleivorans]|uniref:Envelope stress response membrane protein PspC n=1 Tax=Sphingomonas oleivorans TaxID=1735121 RepID=A0A2T5FTI4_9SPHN|nr:envelope stress response membrane protein PspC [Sphingomonas oleivorans]PTQ07377.1 envelope stress response membrane protein PspC [Sphingomonas oleivorans]